MCIEDEVLLALERRGNVMHGCKERWPEPLLKVGFFEHLPHAHEHSHDTLTTLRITLTSIS